MASSAFLKAPACTDEVMDPEAATPPLTAKPLGRTSPHRLTFVAAPRRAQPGVIVSGALDVSRCGYVYAPPCPASATATHSAPFSSQSHHRY